jgi:hypothetical protein
MSIDDLPDFPNIMDDLANSFSECPVLSPIRDAMPVQVVEHGPDINTKVGV